jgi:hypothetical protein
MALVSDWQAAEAALPAGWTEARVRLALEQEDEEERALALLAPLQPLRSGRAAVSLRVVRGGSGPSPAGLARAFARLDAERLHARLSVDEIAERAPAAAPAATPAAPSLPESWDAALAVLPADWSALLGEIELDSSDYLEPGALALAPLNPRRIGDSLRLQFRSASSFGYGASPGMVRRCLERCDAAGMRGHVSVLRVLSDTRPVGTQGPVWQIDGQTA